MFMGAPFGSPDVCGTWRIVAGRRSCWEIPIGYRNDTAALLRGLLGSAGDADEIGDETDWRLDRQRMQKIAATLTQELSPGLLAGPNGLSVKCAASIAGTKSGLSSVTIPQTIKIFRASDRWKCTR
jgi:hypothetical protein